MFTFIETPLFTRLVTEYLSDEEYGQLQVALIENPEAGAIIPGAGGSGNCGGHYRVGRGKRGGLRVIYYLRSAQGVVWMLTLYPKNVAENIPAHVLRKIRKEIEDG